MEGSLEQSGVGLTLYAFEAAGASGSLNHKLRLAMRTANHKSSSAGDECQILRGVGFQHIRQLREMLELLKRQTDKTCFPVLP